MNVRIWFLAATFGLFFDTGSPMASEHDLDVLRAEMVAGIVQTAKLAAAQTGVPSIDAQILDALAQIPRHLFVPEEFRPFAYLETPLPVGYGQNIASPFLTALMTQVAGIGPEDVVFETGTGAGYHAAVLGRLAAQVYSVEVIGELVAQAVSAVAAVGAHNVHIRAGDGYFGWAEQAPFDAIIVKEAVDHMPQPLFEQLKPGGRLVLPLGPAQGPQQLTVIEKLPDGKPRRRQVLEVIFSPLQGGQRI